MTLNYLHPNADKVGMRNAAKANGDTHIYLYTRNGGDNGGGSISVLLVPNQIGKQDWMNSTTWDSNQFYG
jgi:hypothetical protein